MKEKKEKDKKEKKEKKEKKHNKDGGEAGAKEKKEKKDKDGKHKDKKEKKEKKHKDLLVPTSCWHAFPGAFDKAGGKRAQTQEGQEGEERKEGEERQEGKGRSRKQTGCEEAWLAASMVHLAQQNMTWLYKEKIARGEEPAKGQTEKTSHQRSAEGLAEDSWHGRCFRL